MLTTTASCYWVIELRGVFFKRVSRTDIQTVGSLISSRVERFFNGFRNRSSKTWPSSFCNFCNSWVSQWHIYLRTSEGYLSHDCKAWIDASRSTTTSIQFTNYRRRAFARRRQGRAGGSQHGRHRDKRGCGMCTGVYRASRLCRGCHARIGHIGERISNRPGKRRGAACEAGDGRSKGDWCGKSRPSLTRHRLLDEWLARVVP